MEADESATTAEAATVPHKTSSGQEEVVYLSDISPRHIVWDKRKADADLVAGVYAQAPDGEFLRYAKRLGECSETLLLTECLNSQTGESGFKADSAKCRARHCPICQSARMKKLRERLGEKALPEIERCFPGGRWLFLTLTVRNCDVGELRQTIQALNRAWQRLVERRELGIVRGWLRSVEVTHGAWIDTRTGREIPKKELDQVPQEYRRPKDPAAAHPHFHALLLVPPSYFGKGYIKHAQWVELWQDCARLDYVPSVSIQPVNTIRGGLDEVLKVFTYSVKPAELADDPTWFYELHRQVHKLRFLAAGGLVKEALKDLEALAGDIAEGKDLDGQEAGRQLVFDWQRPVKRYCKRKEISGHVD